MPSASPCEASRSPCRPERQPDPVSNYAFFVFAASPGPDNMAIVARTLSSGAASGLAYGTGTTVGILIFLVLAAFGLSVLASKMTLLMTVLRYGGAAYLVWMGIKIWTAKSIKLATRPVSKRRDLVSIFATGVALNLGNPKMPLFYLVLLPNVIGASLTADQVGILAAIIICVEVIVVGGHVFLAERARTLLRCPLTVRRVNRAAGGLLVSAAVAAAALG